MYLIIPNFKTKGGIQSYQLSKIFTGGTFEIFFKKHFTEIPGLTSKLYSSTIKRGT